MSEQPMKRNFIKALAALFIGVNVIIVTAVLLKDSEPPQRAMPHPNGYDDFVRAGKLVILGNVDTTKLNHDELVALVASNRDALAALRTGLTHESLVLDNYSATNGDVLLTDYAAFKKLSWIITGEGRVAEMEGRTNEAAKIYLEAAHFGQDSSRGGVMMARLVGIACENIALNYLRPLGNQLDATNSRAMARELEAIDATEDTPEQTLQQEARWARKTYGIRGQIVLLVTHKQQKVTRDSFTTKDQNLMRARRRTMLSFAAHAYELEKGKPPVTAADLVPDYLKVVPKDPTTGQDLRLGQ